MGKPPRQTGQRVAFTAAAAKRIARVVQTVEGGDRSIGRPATRTGGDDGNLVRGTFTGAWAKGTQKEVTDAVLRHTKYMAQNPFANLTDNGEPRHCVLAHIYGQWVLIATEC